MLSQTKARKEVLITHDAMKLDPLTSTLHGSPLKAGGAPGSRKSLSHARQIALPFWVRSKGMGKLSSYGGAHLIRKHARDRRKLKDLVLPNGVSGRTASKET